MKIGIISDTHDDNESVTKAVQIFKDNGVEQVFHLGDYVGPGLIKSFEGLKLIGVFGNNDGDRFRLINKFKLINAEIKGDFYETEIDGLQIALYHGTEPPIVEALANCGKYDFVFYGHEHIKDNRQIGKTQIVNPGTANRQLAKDKPSIVLFDTSSKEVEFISI